MVQNPSKQEGIYQCLWLRRTITAVPIYPNVPNVIAGRYADVNVKNKHKSRSKSSSLEISFMRPLVTKE